MFCVKRGGGDSNDRVIIFFTGHGLFFPTTVEEFRKQVVERDKFEWMNLSTNQDIYNSASTIIFVRDVYKNWCINGINANINTQEKLEDYLRQIVGNREVVTVGSSAGGYMAILFGILLKAKTIYSFSPQVNLHAYNIDHPIKYYEEYLDNPNICRHMDLTPMMSQFQGELFYFVPMLCTEDIRQFDLAKKCKNVHFFKLEEKRHGYTIWCECMIKTLTMDEGKLIELCSIFEGKCIKPVFYALKSIGIRKTTILLLKKTIRKIISKK